MPELPEVETTRRGIAPLITHAKITDVQVRDRRLRQPVPRTLKRTLLDQSLLSVRRRAKYLLLGFERGTLIVHLGMSGSLRVLPAGTPAQKHDHVDITFDHQHCLRFRDPRRFGLVLWTHTEIDRHPLIKHLGPEPWDEAFNPTYLHGRANGRQLAVKNFIMDAKIVVGVGNIYASESLHRAGIHPSRHAGRISLARYAELVSQIQIVLNEAISAGGTTLRDFVNSEGKPGYFRQDLRVYGRTGEKCACGGEIQQRVIGQRSSFFCADCQR